MHRQALKWFLLDNFKDLRYYGVVSRDHGDTCLWWSDRLHTVRVRTYGCSSRYNTLFFLYYLFILAAFILFCGLVTSREIKWNMVLNRRRLDSQGSNSLNWQTCSATSHRCRLNEISTISQDTFFRGGETWVSFSYFVFLLLRFSIGMGFVNFMIK